jgi:ribosomal protein L37AE/L43A
MKIRQVRECPCCTRHAQTLSNSFQWLKHCKQYLKQSGEWQHETEAGKAFHSKHTKNTAEQMEENRYKASTVNQ